MTDDNPANSDIWRHRWADWAREQAGYPKETLVETLRRLEASDDPAAKDEWRRLTGTRPG